MSNHLAMYRSLRKFVRASALMSALALAGCVTVPESIRGTSPTPQDDLVRVMNAPQLYVGQEARMGGKVVKVTNLNGRTRLEIAASNLDQSARPLLHQGSIGRLVAYVNGFLDPVDFTNQWVTVVGPITGSEKGTIGQADYNFVVVQANAFKRWRLTQQVMPPMGPPVSPWGWNGYYGPGWGPGWNNYYGPADVETILAE